ncbi:hypothetical protein JRQ81_001858 [Phrynocephalus forsythii]|uniref:Uncharacterized protein n=1 Tax=Phrynocephalus forsythii TaxID=171643 RepID=A0A9Q0Y940_9SAUR|nr:hypothetical protein JRQ81_001858 [Phrynocephalus forsythii]
MKKKTEYSSWKPVPQSKDSPCDRFKHACCICRGFLYVYGGRQSTTLSDFWRYKIESGEWERLDNSEDGPEELEEHTMVEHQDVLYIFGGMVDSPFTQKKSPLWMYDTDSTKWIECQLTAVKGEGTAPVNRKGHSAVVYRGSMYMYGGYIDIRGASPEFWALHFDTKQWTLVSATSYGVSPGPRHGHSAVVYGKGMYLFGGLMGLSEQNDFWKWDFMATTWSNIRKSQGPPKVVGHSALTFEDSMLVFGGGVSHTRPNSTWWQFHFPSQMWKKLASSTEPLSKSYHCTLGTGYGFQRTADSPGTSLSCLHREQKGCSKCIALSKQHACFWQQVHQEPTYQIFSNEEGSEIEMKTFRHSQEETGLCFSHPTCSAELSTNQAESILSRQERTFYPNHSREEDLARVGLTEEEGSFGCLCPPRVAFREPPVVLLLGGKPLSSSSAVSFWQMELSSP